jgi:hypothetical protein
MTRFCHQAILIMLVSFSGSIVTSQVGKNSDLDGILGRFPGYHLLTLQELTRQRGTLFSGASRSRTQASLAVTSMEMAIRITPYC